MPSVVSLFYMRVIIAGIHTGIGKTICSALICQARGWDYWKPVQAGELDNSDSITVNRLVSNKACSIHPERYRLQISASPHYAAAEEGISIRPEDFTVPDTRNSLVIETAGGVMSPLAAGFLNIDLMRQLDAPAILVSNHYLGSINHTLLTVAALRQAGIPLLGLVFSGEQVPSTGSFIQEHTGLPLLFSIPPMKELNAETMFTLANQTDLSF